MNEKLLEAAKAVIERWDSPLWKDLQHTGEFINRLREAVADSSNEKDNFNVGWIGVDDRLPMFERVLVKAIGTYFVASRGGQLLPDGSDFTDDWQWDVFNDVNFKKDEVTHWMPLTALQKAEKIG